MWLLLLLSLQGSTVLGTFGSLDECEAAKQRTELVHSCMCKKFHDGPN